MSEDLHRSGPNRRSTDMPEGLCALHETLVGDLGEIKGGIRRIESRLGSGDISLATLALRVQYLEKLVYGAVALALTAVGGAIVALVIKSGGAT